MITYIYHHIWHIRKALSTLFRRRPDKTTPRDSEKRNTTSCASYKVQGTRYKVQGTRYKLQATSYKLQATSYKTVQVRTCSRSVYQRISISINCSTFAMNYCFTSIYHILLLHTTPHTTYVILII